MKEVLVKVPDKKYDFFMELIRNLDFVKKVGQDKEPTKEEILQGIKEAVHEVNLIKAGKLRAISAKELLREL